MSLLNLGFTPRRCTLCLRETALTAKRADDAFYRCDNAACRDTVMCERHRHQASRREGIDVCIDHAPQEDAR